MIAHREEKLLKEFYHVPKASGKNPITVTVPGSKSITNRALLLAALSEGPCLLKGVLFSDDSRAVLSCLEELGFELEIREAAREVRIVGTGGRIPRPDARLNVRSAGTAARFLTVFLAFAGGDYQMDASSQMKKRPMEPLLSILRKAGAVITCQEEEGHFPFRLQAHRLKLSEVTVDTTVSSQFASAFLMTGTLLPGGLTVRMEGDRTQGAYIQITRKMMEQFGLRTEEQNGAIRIPGGQKTCLEEYVIEPDVSGACYFYGMAPLLGIDVTVRGIHPNSMQGDLKFLSVLREMGCPSEDTETGICVLGSRMREFRGVTVNMKEFSDQTMTLAAIAPFASTETKITNIGHIRFQESDRIAAICTELQRMGIDCHELPEEDGILIRPGTPGEATVETYEDHRMAMAFSLPGLKTGTITISDPGCCRKTFENYFDLLTELFGGPSA